jgi:hypothetical protein
MVEECSLNKLLAKETLAKKMDLQKRRFDILSKVEGGDDSLKNFDVDVIESELKELNLKITELTETKFRRK